MTADGENPSEALPPNETKRILKNVLVISFVFMIHFAADHGASNLQSSINAEAGLGTASLASHYVAVILSSLFLPVVLIKWFGTKWTMTFSLLFFIPYIVVQLWPSFYTLIPAGFLVGLLGGAPLWCAMFTYISVVSKAHSQISKISEDILLTRFLGMFYMVFHISQLWGNLISSLVLSTEDNIAAMTSINVSMIPIVCGANFLPRVDASMALPPQPPEKIKLLVGIFVACIVGAVLLMTFGVDSTKRYINAHSKKEPEKSAAELLSATLKLMVDPNQLLLAIISIFIGLQIAFVRADFSAAYVSCAIGTGSVGYVMMAYGMAEAICCMLNGYIVKIIGRVQLICVAVVVNSLFLVTLLVWRPQAHLNYVLYLLAVVIGLCNSIWAVQITAYYGILFRGREEAAFSNFRLFESIGFVVAYIQSSYCTTSAKTYLLLGTMLVGAAGFFTVEYRHKRLKRTWHVTSKENDKGCTNVAYIE